MGVVLLQILQWILRIILFLLILLLVLGTIILIVPIRYRAEWDFLEKKARVRGRITWFFYLIYMRFYYEEEFRMQVRVFGFKVFDSENGGDKPKKTKAGQEENKDADDLTAWETEMEAEAKEEAELAKQIAGRKVETLKQGNLQDKEYGEDYFEQEIKNSQVDSENLEESISGKDKKSFSEKIDNIKSKIQDIIQKIKDIIAKIRDGKLKVEHYLELWNRKETQITFGRAKTKLGRMIKAVLPRKWKITGEIGFTDPCTTGQLMGVLGAMYPILGNKVQIVPDFEEQVINLEGNLKGHIRLGNLLYQLVSLLLNRYCFKFIKLIFDELGSSKKGRKSRKHK